MMIARKLGINMGDCDCDCDCEGEGDGDSDRPPMMMTMEGYLSLWRLIYVGWDV